MGTVIVIIVLAAIYFIPSIVAYGRKNHTAAIFAHPHPLGGGTMHNKVAYRAAQELARAGWSALRFNFRGVGLSEGRHDAGRGEVGDFRAAVDLAATTHPGPLLAGGFSFGWFTPAVVGDVGFFRYHFLDLMAGMLLAPVHYAIVHAACVAYRDTGFLLCGHSGAGKSTLAYGCSQRGWTFISDDASYVPLRFPSRAVVGNPLLLRLRENAPDLFPQLQNRLVILRQNGEFGFELPTDTLPGLTRAFQANIDNVVFLDRRPSGPARLLPYSKEEARFRLENVLDYTLACKGRDNAEGSTDGVLTNAEVRGRQKAAVSELLTARVHELTYSALDEAIDCLEELANGKENTTNR